MPFQGKCQLYHRQPRAALAMRVCPGLISVGPYRGEIIDDTQVIEVRCCSVPLSPQHNITIPNVGVVYARFTGIARNILIANSNIASASSDPPTIAPIVGGCPKMNRMGGHIQRQVQSTARVATLRNGP